MFNAVVVGLFMIIYNINEYYEEITAGFLVIGLIGLVVVCIYMFGINNTPRGKTLMQIFIIIALVSFAGGNFTGWKITSNSYEAKMIEQVNQALKKQAQQLDESFQAEKVALQQTHEQELKDNVIIREIPKYITQIQKVKSACSYSNGTVRMLNRVASRDVQEAAAVPDAKDTEPSGVTELSGIKYTGELLAGWHKFQTQCNALIDFLNDR